MAEIGAAPVLAGMTTIQLLQTYASILDELRRREVVRSSNNPLSDYAELLFCRAFGWKRMGNSSGGYDALDSANVRYQIKARRLTPQSGSRQLSAIRKLDEDPFHHLCGLLVDERFSVLRAVIVPISVVRKRSVHVAHTNSWRFLLHDDVWTLNEARDVTSEIAATAAQL